MLFKYNKGLHTGNWEVQKKAKSFVEKIISNEGNLREEFLNIEVFSALFCKRNEIFLEEMRLCFREKLVELCDNFNQKKDSLTNNEKLLNKYICNLPLAGIKTGQKYLIPTYDDIDQKWQLITYKVAPIELTPTYGIGRLVLLDNNRYFAYGFTPDKIKLSEEQMKFAKSRLVFVSPEYPAQQGFLANLYLWFQSVSKFYKYCQPQIDHWLKETSEYTQNKVIVHALGRASRLALESVFTESAQYIEREYITDAYSLPNSLFVDYKDRWEKQKNKPKISIQMHKNHYNFGQVLTGWELHDSNDSTIPVDVFEKCFYNLVICNILSGVVDALLVMPCKYLIVPIVRTILNHKTELALLCILSMVYLMLPGLIMTDIGATIAIFTALYFAYKFIEPIKVIFDVHEKSEASCHITNHHEEIEDDEFRDGVLLDMGIK